MGLGTKVGTKKEKDYFGGDLSGRLFLRHFMILSKT